MPEPVSFYIIAFNQAQNVREALPVVLRADEIVMVVLSQFYNKAFEFTSKLCRNNYAPAICD